LFFICSLAILCFTTSLIFLAFFAIGEPINYHPTQPISRKQLCNLLTKINFLNCCVFKEYFWFGIDRFRPTLQKVLYLSPQNLWTLWFRKYFVRILEHYLLKYLQNYFFHRDQSSNLDTLINTILKCIKWYRIGPGKILQAVSLKYETNSISLLGKTF
jgi:hypothetical protein